MEEVFEGPEDAVRYCLPRVFWLECQKSNCMLDQCQAVAITTINMRRDPPIVFCRELSLDRAGWHQFEQKPPYHLHPVQHVLWAFIGLLISIVPFAIFGGGTAIPAMSSFFRAKKKKKVPGVEGEVNQVNDAQKKSNVLETPV